MNVNELINKYYQKSNVSIEMFDDNNIYNVYYNIVQVLLKHSDIEVSVLEALSYSMYEILDNVLVHSGKECGIALSAFDKPNSIKILVADDGIGIANSLRTNNKYQRLSDRDAVLKCLDDAVTDGKGMGFGLYSALRLIMHAGTKLIIHSGSYTLVHNGTDYEITETEYWQGTIVYLEIISDIEISPNDVFENRTDAVSGFDDVFLDNDDIDKLW